VRRTRSPSRYRQRCRAEEGPAQLIARQGATVSSEIRLQAMPVAFYGRTAHAADTRDGQADRHRQLTLCRAIVPAYGGHVTAGYFDEDCRADNPWSRRPQGQALLAALTGPARSAWGLVAADIWRLLPRRTPANRTAILQQLAQRHVLLVLADTGAAALTTGEYALLSSLMTGLTSSALIPGSATMPARLLPPAGRAARQPRGGEPG
jgi:hypothetical protein